MTLESLLHTMPPYKGDGVYIIKGDQSTRDLIKEQRAAHKFFASDYDKAAVYFSGKAVKRICRELFHFCKDYLKYQEEEKDLQTSRSPGAILTIAKNGGTCDCKHYAAFVAGMLDSLNRNFGYNIDWVYRFASYDMFDKTPTHVYVVVYAGDGELWIDPAPVRDWFGYKQRDYNDRYLIPEFFKDKQVNTMSIVRLAGLGRPAVMYSSQGTDQEGVLLMQDAVDTKDGAYMPPVTDLYYDDPGYYPQQPVATVPQYYEEPVIMPVSPGYFEPTILQPVPDNVMTVLPVPVNETQVVPLPEEVAVIPYDPPAEEVQTTQDKSNNTAVLMGVVGAGLLLFFLTRKKKRK